MAGKSVDETKMILGIESSCDESALALIEPSTGIIHAELIASQVTLHAEYGGVVPDLATRAHLDNFPNLLGELARQVPHWQEKVDTIAVTSGPGLAGCLATGIATAKALRIAHPTTRVVGVNHLRGHAYSPFIPNWIDYPGCVNARIAPYLPHLGLIVSGGNTLLVKIDEHLRIKVLAETVDDAAGEALDKGAKLLGMPYPGGPHIERVALEGNTAYHPFPVAAGARNDRRFSFSGLKTSLRYLLEKTDDATLRKHLSDICASYQFATIEQLARKTTHIWDTLGPFKSIGLSGGVSNNGALRDRFAALTKKLETPLLLAERRHTGDNATMIAFAAHLDSIGCDHSGLDGLSFNPSWSIDHDVVDQPPQTSR